MSDSQRVQDRQRTGHGAADGHTKPTRGRHGLSRCCRLVVWRLLHALHLLQQVHVHSGHGHEHGHGTSATALLSAMHCAMAVRLREFRPDQRRRGRWKKLERAASVVHTQQVVENAVDVVEWQEMEQVVLVAHLPRAHDVVDLGRETRVCGHDTFGTARRATRVHDLRGRALKIMARQPAAHGRLGCISHRQYHCCGCVDFLATLALDDRGRPRQSCCCF